MKSTLTTVTMFVLLTLIFSNRALAKLPSANVIQDSNVKIQIELPTATPTPIIFKKVDPNINLQLIPTIPSAKLTVTLTPSPETKLTVTPEPTLGTKLTVTPTEEKTEISPTVEATKSQEMTANKTDLKSWFMGITIGLLALIIIVQLFPKKKEDQ